MNSKVWREKFWNYKHSLCLCRSRELEEPGMHGRRRGSPTANLARSVSNILQNNPQFVSRLLITIQYFTNTPLLLDGLLISSPSSASSTRSRPSSACRPPSSSHSQPSEPSSPFIFVSVDSEKLRRNHKKKIANSK